MAETSQLIFATYNICDVLRDLVSFAKFKKREKHPWRNTPPRVFFTFFKLYQIAQRIIYKLFGDHDSFGKVKDLVYPHDLLSLRY